MVGSEGSGVQRAKTDQVAETPSALVEWQRRLLPFMISLLIALAIFSCVANVMQVHFVQQHIEMNHEVDLQKMMEGRLPAGASQSEQLAYAKWETLVILESNALGDRYHQASMIIMTRTYIVFLGFTTGMVLALLGSAFILGKLRETTSSVEASGPSLKLALTSASPGIILAFLGTALMVSTLFAQSEVNTKDAALYAIPDNLASFAGQVPPDPTSKSKAEIERIIKDKLNELKGSDHKQPQEK